MSEDNKLFDPLAAPRGDGDNDKVTIECTAERVEFVILDDRYDAQDIIRDTSKLVEGPDGRPTHPPLLDKLGNVQQRRAVRVRLTKGERATVPWRCVPWQWRCPHCGGANNSDKANRCRDFEAHRKDYLVSGGTVGANQIKIVGEDHAPTPDMLDALRAEERIKGGQPETSK